MSKIIIMPNGDGVLASTITRVDHRPERVGADLETVRAAFVAVDGRNYNMPDDETAVSERDRILAEWQAAIEGRPDSWAYRAERAERALCLHLKCTLEELLLSFGDGAG